VASLYSVGNMWNRKRAVLAFLFQNQLAMMMFLNCWLCSSHLSCNSLNRLVPSVLLLGFLDVGEVETCGAVVSTICDIGGGVCVLDFLFRGLLDLIFWKDCSCAIIARASFCQLWFWVMQGSSSDGCMEEAGVTVNGNDDSLMGDVCCILSGHETGPMKVDVVLSFVDKGGEDVEVVVGGVCSDKDNSIIRSKSEYGGGGETMVAEVGVLLGVRLGGVGRHDGGWSSESRVLILVGCCSNSTSNSGVWKSSVFTHESWAGEYPFYQTRYCFFFQQPKALSLRTCSTSHSGLPSMMSGGSSMKLGPCMSVSLYDVRSDMWKTSWIFQ